MPAITKKNSKANSTAVVKKLKDYSKEPAFVKKAEKASASLKKHGLPKSFTKRKK